MSLCMYSEMLCYDRRDDSYFILVLTLQIVMKLFTWKSDVNKKKRIITTRLSEKKYFFGSLTMF